MMMMETGALPQAGRRMWQLVMLLRTAAALMQSVPGGLALADDGGAEVRGALSGALLSRGTGANRRRSAQRAGARQRRRSSNSSSTDRNTPVE